MAKPWTKQELQIADKMQAENKPYKEIAEELGRSVKAVGIKICRELGRIRFCVDCGEKILDPKGNHLRCDVCSLINTNERVKIVSCIFHLKNKERINKKRRQQRFCGNREKVIQRDNEKCVKCGMTRKEHKKKYKKDLVVFNPKAKNRKSRIINDPIENLITVCLKCQGKLRVKHRSKDYSMCGGRRGMKPETKEKELTVRCSSCDQYFKIYYDPRKNLIKWSNQKCPHCKDKPNYIKKEKLIF